MSRGLRHLAGRFRIIATSMQCIWMDNQYILIHLLRNRLRHFVTDRLRFPCRRKRRKKLNKIENNDATKDGQSHR